MQKLTNLNNIYGGKVSQIISTNTPGSIHGLDCEAHYNGKTFFNDESITISTMEHTIASKDQSWLEVFGYAGAGLLCGGVIGSVIGGLFVYFELNFAPQSRYRHTPIARAWPIR